MACGKVKPIAKKCRYCGAINEAGPRRIKSGLCYGCRKSKHEPRGITVSKGAKVRLAVILSVISFVFLTLAGYAIYFKHLVLPYGSRVRSRLLEFNGLGVTLPAVALILLSVGTLSSVAVNNYRYSYKQLFKKIMKVCLWAGFILYFVSIFFGTRFTL